MPDVVGQTQSEADVGAHRSGLHVTVVQVPSSGSSTGKVIAQTPSPGYHVNPGSTVTIPVGTGPSGTTTTT